MERRVRTSLFSLAVIGLLFALASPASAQIGRVFGEVRDEQDRPVEGAQITAENPNAVPSKFTAKTNDKGEFAMVGLRNGTWIITVEAPGYAPTQAQTRLTGIGKNDPLIIKLIGGGPAADDGMAGVDVESVRAELTEADNLFNQQQYDQALSAYQAILEKVPALTVLNLKIADVHRAKKDYDAAIAAYETVLAADPTYEGAKIGLGETYLLKNDPAAAEKVLTEAASSPTAGRDVFYNLGQAKSAQGKIDEAIQWFQKASEVAPTWGKPLLQLGLLSAAKQDNAGAVGYFQKVIELDPNSPEAAQAKVFIEQLPKS